MFFDEVEFIFKTLFFVYMGICMRVGAWGPVAAGLLVVLVKFLLRLPVADFCTAKTMSRGDTAVLWAMCPNGLVSAVLAAMAAQQLPGEGETVQDVVYAVIFFGVILSNLLSFRLQKGGLQGFVNSAFSRHISQ